MVMGKNGDWLFHGSFSFIQIGFYYHAEEFAAERRRNFWGKDCDGSDAAELESPGNNSSQEVSCLLPRPFVSRIRVCWFPQRLVRV